MTKHFHRTLEAAIHQSDDTLENLVEERQGRPQQPGVSRRERKKIRWINHCQKKRELDGLDWEDRSG